MTPEQRATTQDQASQGRPVAVDAVSADLCVEITPAAPETRELVARAKDGDRAAFAALYRMYLPTVYKFLYYRMNCQRATAEDMTAEVFLRALRKIGDFNWTGADFGAWLLRIARNLVLDNAKSSRARLEVLNDQMPEDAAGAECSTESAVMDNLRNRDVYRAIRALSPDQRDVITMRFIQGMDVADVAAALGKKEGTVRTLQFRGLRALHRLLAADGFVEIVDTAIRPDGVRLATNGRGEGRTESEAARFGVAEGER